MLNVPSMQNPENRTFSTEEYGYYIRLVLLDCSPFLKKIYARAFDSRA
eukprot:COSAG02_NODE_8685_length_2479_cov_1.989496_3_plen_48_part_00